MEKDFAGWHLIKTELDIRKDLPTFSEREIWWCSMGVNIGYEIFGKNDKFVRPVLIIRKYSRSTFFGLPMTSKRKNNVYHYHLDFKGRQGSVLLDQGRTIDSRRLIEKMGRLNDPAFDSIKDAFVDCLKQ